MNPLESKPDAEVHPSDDPPPVALPGLPLPAVEEPVESRPVESRVEAPPEKEVHKKDKDREKGKDKEKEKEKEKDKDKDREKGKDKDKDKKKKKKEKKEFERAGPWERYKALLDSVKESQDLVDLADHKARFALIIMGALNAAIILLGTRSDLLLTVPPNLKIGLYSYFVVYAIIAIYFLVQAIESLRPRSIPDVALKDFSDRDESLGLRFFVDALRYDTPTYLKAWQSVRISQLNAELATQLHTLARINKAKYNAVAKLYLGLQAITVLTAGLLVALGVAAWVEHRIALPATATVEAEEQVPKIKGGKPKKGGWSILGEPERFAVAGVREPSGVAFSPGRGTLFVVGDEGSLVEVGTDGTVRANIPTGGNLEDVALHTPSGRLVLLSEKKGELLVLDPATGRKTGTFKLDNEALLGGAAVDKNQGFEGLAFRPEAGRPGGGVFYLVHQRLPAVIVAIAFDPLAPSGRVGAAHLVSRAPVGTRDDLTAVTYEASLDRLFVIADSKDRLAMLGLTGAEEAEIVLPGVQQEGLSFDAEGNLWIADDRAGLLVFREARQRIAEEMKAPRPELPAADGPTASKPS